MSNKARAFLEFLKHGAHPIQQSDCDDDFSHSGDYFVVQVSPYCDCDDLEPVMIGCSLKTLLLIFGDDFDLQTVRQAVEAFIKTEAWERIDFGSGNKVMIELHHDIPYLSWGIRAMRNGYHEAWILEFLKDLTKYPGTLAVLDKVYPEIKQIPSINHLIGFHYLLRHCFLNK